jgi:Tol biopolymer transport system component
MNLLYLLSTLLMLQAPAPQPAPRPAPPPGTDIYLLPLRGGLASLKTTKPQPVSTAPGYDNQPNFSADGTRVLFAGNRDGKQIDVFVFNRDNGRVAQLTKTAENENSPTFVPDGAGPAGTFSVVQTEPDRSQRLWKFTPDGTTPQLVLTDIKPVGYHAWIDATHLVLFVLGQPATLQIADVKTGKGEVVAEAIGRSLHRIPGTRLASFVHREVNDEWWVKQIDIATKKIDPLVKAAEGSSDRDMAWMPDGKTILMSAGTKIMSWTRGASGWTEVFDTSAHQLGTVTRIAVSPKGDAIAIVVAEPQK